MIKGPHCKIRLIYDRKRNEIEEEQRHLYVDLRHTQSALIQSLV